MWRVCRRTSCERRSLRGKVEHLAADCLMLTVLAGRTVLSSAVLSHLRSVVFFSPAACGQAAISLISLLSLSVTSQSRFLALQHLINSSSTFTQHFAILNSKCQHSRVYSFSLQTLKITVCFFPPLRSAHFLCADPQRVRLRAAGPGFTVHSPPPSLPSEIGVV